MRACVVLLALSGCLHDQLVPCGDVLCPTNFTCDTERSVCIDPQGLSVPPQAIDFANVACGTTATGTLAIKNFSASPIDFSAVSTVAGITASPSSGEFPAGGTVELQLSAAVPVSSTPASPIEGALLIATGGGVTERHVRLTTLGASLDMSVQQLDFGEGTVGMSDTRAVTFTNTGNAGIDLVPTVNPTMPATNPPSFALAAAGPVHVGPGETSSLGVTFTPQTLASFSSTVAVAPTGGALCQDVPKPVALSGLATTDLITVDYLALDFGIVDCGAVTAKALPLTITNHLATDQPLTMSLAGPDASLFAFAQTASVGAMSSVTTTVVRNPIPPTSPVGGKTALLRIDAPGPPATTKMITIKQLIVAPVLQVDTTSYDFGTVPKNSITNKTIVVVNSGNGNATVSVSPSSAPLPGNGLLKISPTSFQIPAGGATPVQISLIAGSVAIGFVDVQFTFSATGECGEAPFMLVSGNIM